MKRNTIWVLVILMAVALLGIGGFQVYWITNVIQLSNERFEKDALESMQRVAQRLERNEMLSVATNSFSFFSSANSPNDTVIHITEERTTREPDTLHEQFWYRTNDNDQIQVIVRSESKAQAQKYFLDSGKSEVNVSIVLSDDDTIDAEDARIESKRKVFTQVMEELMMHEVSPVNRVHPVIIDSLLSQEFRNHGIRLAYEFGVYDAYQNKFSASNVRNRQTLEKATLRANLFPNDILNSNLLLLVNFPDKSRYLLDKVWVSLLTSVVFILMIIGIFGYVVYQVVHQRKVAELKNDFINNMTHEFKTPIATVSLATEALKENAVLSSREATLRYIGVIQQESKRLGSQVEKVLQLASMEKKNLSLQKEVVSASLLVESAIERARFQAEERGGKIDKQSPSDHLMIEADETHFSNAIFNLIDNGIKYSTESPEITVRLEPLGEKLNISVSDKGIGLTRGQQSQIFDKFFRVPTGDLHNVKGFGLGLNYVKYIVEEHDGSISVESQIDKGSTFTITVPLANEAV